MMMMMGGFIETAKSSVTLPPMLLLRKSLTPAAGDEIKIRRNQQHQRVFVRASVGAGGNNSSSSSSELVNKKKKSSGSSNTANYVVPLDKTFDSSNSSCITRPLAEILRDLNNRIPDNMLLSPPPTHHLSSTFIPWYHANRMLSFYAPGWCGEVCDIIFSDNGNVTVVYRVTIRGSDGEAHREATGTVSSTEGQIRDTVAAAEEIAFCKACARFGLGLYLYHQE